MGTERRGRTARSTLVAALALSLLTAACGGDDSSPQNDANASTEPGLAAVSVGDSYASGAGAPPYDQDSGSCQRSGDGWARRLDTDSVAIGSTDHRACGGAQAHHLTEPWPERGLPPQLPERPEPAVDLVTLTIGGNDMGFGTMVWACTTGDCLPASAFAEPLTKLDTALRTSLYPALHEAYPNARIVHVGYPRLTPPVGTPPVGCSWLGEADQRAATETIDALNHTIEQATRDADVTYVDVSDVLAGHEMCTPSPWMRNIGDKAPVHPNDRGQVAIERAVAKALDIEITP